MTQTTRASLFNEETIRKTFSRYDSMFDDLFKQITSLEKDNKSKDKDIKKLEKRIKNLELKKQSEIKK